MAATNLLVTMAGKSLFFAEEEYHFPKPLIEIGGKTMVQRLIENLDTIDNVGERVFVVSNEDCKKYHLDDVIRILSADSARVIKLEKQTRGAACSALMAIEHINNDAELVISNADQIIDIDLDEALDSFRRRDLDAGVITFDTVHPRWSYVRLDEQERITETAEKRPLSRHAIAGLFWFRRGADFVDAAMRMIRKDAQVNGAFYIAPVLNELILSDCKLGVFPIDARNYHSFYSPQKIKEFEAGSGATSG